jgi:hypothetical protein
MPLASGRGVQTTDGRLLLLFVPEITLLNFKCDLAWKVFLAAGSASIIM